MAEETSIVHSLGCAVEADERANQDDDDGGQPFFLLTSSPAQTQTQHRIKKVAASKRCCTHLWITNSRCFPPPRLMLQHVLKGMDAASVNSSMQEVFLMPTTSIRSSNRLRLGEKKFANVRTSSSSVESSKDDRSRLCPISKTRRKFASQVRCFVPKLTWLSTTTRQREQGPRKES